MSVLGPFGTKAETDRQNLGGRWSVVLAKFASQGKHTMASESQPTGSPVFGTLVVHLKLNCGGPWVSPCGRDQDIARRWARSLVGIGFDNARWGAKNGREPSPGVHGLRLVTPTRNAPPLRACTGGYRASRRIGHRHRWRSEGSSPP